MSDLKFAWIIHYDKIQGNLSFSTTLQILSLSCLLAIAWIYIRKVRGVKSDFDKIPGPPSIPLVGSLYEVLLPGYDVFKKNLEWFRKYGSIYKGTMFHIKQVKLCDPAHIQTVLTSTQPSHLNKPKRIYDSVMDGNISQGLIVSDYPIWKPHRKVISRAFSYTGIQNQIAVIAKHTRSMIANLMDISGKGETPDGKISKLINQTALDNILYIIMGSSAESTTEDRREFHKNFLILKHAGSQRITQPWLLLRPIYRLHSLSKRAKAAATKVREFLAKMILKCRISLEESRKSTKLDEDETGVKPFRCMMEEMLEAGFSDEEIFHEAVTMIIAGHETSSWSTTFLLLRLALNSDIQEKCRQEIDTIFSSKGESSDLSIGDLGKLDYLDRCMKENLRLTPIIPLFVRRLDAPLKLEDDLVLNPGVDIVIFPWVVHRNPEIYPNPEKFDPDRFLPEECKKRHPYAYIPFSGGPRNCIGWKIAPLTIKLVTAYILRNFVTHTNNKWEDLEFVFDVSVATKKDVNLVLEKRR